jgi:Cytosol aminopeptidase family, N-terminal domain
VQVALLPIELSRWDQAPAADALCVPVWTDVRPLRGAAGLLDWRMCGRLSALLASGKVTGRQGEQTLFPTTNRLPWRLVLALGGGPRRDFSDKRFSAGVRQALNALRGLGARRLALALPGRDGERATTGPTASLTSRRALDLLLEAVDESPETLDELTVIAPAAVQKELGEVLRLRSVRAAAGAPRVAPARRGRKA